MLYSLFLYVSLSLGGSYLDEEYYIRSGLDYIRCVPPGFSNPEHPPLGKYLIGLSSLVSPRIVPVLAGALAVLSLFFTVRRVRDGSAISVLTSAILISEVVFVKVFGYALLDTVAAGFAAAATYFSLFSYRPYVSGILWGAAIASKLSTAYPLLGVVVFRLLERRFSYLVKEVLTASSVFLASFVGDLVCPGGGLGVLASHILFIPSYMTSVHELSIHKAIHGLSVALTKTGFWRTYPAVTVTAVPGYTAITTIALEGRAGLELHIYPWLSGLLLPCSLAILTYALLTYRSLRKEARLVTLATVASFINVLHGPVFWYFSVPAYYTALLAGLTLSRRVLTVLAVANVASLLLVYVLGLRYTIAITLVEPG